MPFELRRFCFRWSRLILNEEGQDLIEYGLIACMLSVAVVVGVKSFATGLLSLFDYINTNLSGVM